MSEIVITSMGPGRFGVQVREGGTETSHQVAVPEAYLEELGVGDADQEGVVRASFQFLLEREPATSIMDSFDLPTIARFFPEYPDELRRRLR